MELPSPLTGFQVQADVASDGPIGAFTIYHEVAIGDWVLENDLYSLGFGRILPHLTLGDARTIEIHDLRRILSLATSKAWRGRLTRRPPFFLTRRYLQSATESGLIDSWQRFELVTPEDLLCEACALTTEEKALQTLWNLVECERDKGAGVLISPMDSNTYDTPGRPNAAFFSGAEYTGGIVYGAVQRESATIFEYLEGRQYIRSVADMLGSVQHKRVRITAEGHVVKERFDAEKRNVEFRSATICSVAAQPAATNIESDAEYRRRKTEELIQSEGIMHVRDLVRRGLEAAIGSYPNRCVVFRDLAASLELGDMAVGHALEYWVKEGIASNMGVVTFGLSHRGIKEMEARLDDERSERRARENLEAMFGATEVRRAEMAGGAGTVVGREPTSVFVGHGRSPLYHQVLTEISSEFGVEVLTFEHLKIAGNEVIGTLKNLLDRSSFAVIIATAEDGSDGEKRARQNVVHEIGLFQGRLGFERVIVLVQQGAEVFSNLAGLIYISFKGEEINETFRELNRALRAAGFNHKNPR